MKIVEIYGPVIQGEGTLIGRPTVFVRTGGCDFRCVWCDSMHAVDPANRDRWSDMTAAEVCDAVERLIGRQWPASNKMPMLVTLSGGNPALQAGLGGVVFMLRERGHEVAVETQGTVAPSWFSGIDYLTLSPKLPSSGEGYEIEKLVRCIEAAPFADVSIKLVVADETDFLAAELLVEKLVAFGHAPPVVLQPCNPLGSAGASPADLIQRLRWLSELALARGMRALVLPQLHVLMYGGEHGR